ncbi:hypothetical protein [Rhodococcus wratislaviensis]|uniref:Uncharacterized protein n=1 Tax=Rhodococcus wratislaviensis NBRC 100605 TaxID=1219028 RepID=X0RB43_RHOWR|nr:hypothetical protein [Rhodococcus wratislaviensis]GAF48240.1 hypothetical protein RW1_051_00040 [Rhodococcus wratislaviensis NBRC 100605]
MSQTEDRPRFYEGQYLAAADLMAAVDYTCTQRARLLVGAHRWGIALGMDLTEVPGPNSTLDVVIQPGYAWDGFGRPIVVPEPAKLSTALFASFDSLFVPSKPPPPPVPVDVWIRYDEARGRGPKPGFETCDSAAAFSRVSERFAVEVGPRTEPAGLRDPIEIAGRTIDAAQALRTFDPSAPELVDASVPQQTLPGDGEHALWLLPLGVVLYQPGSPGKFVTRDDVALSRHAQSRQYCGVVAGSIEATSGVVRVHDRGKPYSTAFTDELLWVEGDLRCDGNIRLYNSRLELMPSHTANTPMPFHVLRMDDPAKGSASMTLVIGDKSAGHNKLVVGPKTGADKTGTDVHPRMVVTDNGNVGIGTSAPAANLDVRGDVVASGDVRFAGLSALGTGTQVRVVWGAVAANGAVAAGDGFTVQKLPGPGRYQVDFATAFTGQPTIVVTRVHLLLTADSGTSVTASETAVVDEVLSDRAVVATADTAGALADGGFTFIAIGPR